MATVKNTATKAPAAAPRAKRPSKLAVKARPAKVTKDQSARHPLARMKTLHSTKASLVKTIAASLAMGGEDAAAAEARLLKVSNQKLLRLATVVGAVQKQFGGKKQLIEAAGKAMGKSSDKPYLAALSAMSLPRLFDLVSASQRRTAAAARARRA